MISFARYYKDKKLISVSMNDMSNLIQDEKNKRDIAEYIYERLYTRFLKMFDFESSEKVKYIKNGKQVNRNRFKEEYKNGFLQIAACSLLVETFSAFLTGVDRTPRNKSKNSFKKVFEYAEEKNNLLKIFKGNDSFYTDIRCGVLHQGETYKNFTITRKGKSLLKDNCIDAFIFHFELKKLLQSYQKELEVSEWNGNMWKACRKKVAFIIRDNI